MESYAQQEEGRDEVQILHDLATALAWLGLQRLPSSSHSPNRYFEKA